MLSKFQKHLETHFPLLKNQTLLVACSGGLDSVVLTNLLHLNNYNIVLAHCNFSLRGNESENDAQFVVNLSKKLGIPIYTQTFETEQFADSNGLSIQMAARRLRYQWFDKIAQQLQIKWILTAHHLDDDLETFLINLSRGTGLQGLLGIPAINQNIIRPLLPFKRKEIVAFAQSQQLQWREDSSNFSDKYLRNALRLHVLPNWKATVPKLLENYTNTKNHLQQSKDLINDYMELIYPKIAQKTAHGIQFSIPQLKKLPHPQAVLFELLSPYQFTAWKDIYNLLEAQTGKKVFSKTHHLSKNRDFLILEEIASAKANNETKAYLITKEITHVQTPLELNFEKVEAIEKPSKNTLFVDEDLLEYPLRLKKWEHGDAFYPFGMQGKKKLSKFFKDEKVSLFDKQKIWLLCSNHQIVWVIGMRADQRYQVTTKTKNILKIHHQL